MASRDADSASHSSPDRRGSFQTSSGSTFPRNLSRGLIGRYAERDLVVESGHDSTNDGLASSDPRPCFIELDRPLAHGYIGS
eukprot:1843167-Rhodomonas_salina.1